MTHSLRLIHACRVDPTVPGFIYVLPIGNETIYIPEFSERMRDEGLRCVHHIGISPHLTMTTYENDSITVVATFATIPQREDNEP